MAMFRDGEAFRAGKGTAAADAVRGSTIREGCGCPERVPFRSLQGSVYRRFSQSVISRRSGVNSIKIPHLRLVSCRSE